MKERLKVAIEKYFRPEFLNRLDDVIVFHSLNKENLKQIVDIELAKVRGRLADRGLELVLTDEAKEFLIDKGYNPDYGARPLRRAIENMIEDPLSEEILRGAFKGKDTITVERRGRRRVQAAQVRGHHQGRGQGRPGRRRRWDGIRKKPIGRLTIGEQPASIQNSWEERPSAAPPFSCAPRSRAPHGLDAMPSSESIADGRSRFAPFMIGSLHLH